VTGTVALTTVTLCSYEAAQRAWAFNQMGSSRRALARVDGLRFWRLLGTGHGRGFSLRPDFSRYGLLAVWESPEASERFMSGSPLMREYRRRSAECWNLWLTPYDSRGAWGGSNPFLPLAPAAGSGPVAVLTRAAIRLSRLRRFWAAVPSTTHGLDRAAGLLASVGTGEMPFVRPATFSIWRSEADLVAYAYGDAQHAEVIRRRADEGWYSEELFARFSPIRSEGTWKGSDPLEGLLP
jgi:heme-degrading monooxygenase HmoA